MYNFQCLVKLIQNSQWMVAIHSTSDAASAWYIPPGNILLHQDLHCICGYGSGENFLLHQSQLFEYNLVCGFGYRFTEIENYNIYNNGTFMKNVHHQLLTKYHCKCASQDHWHLSVSKDHRFVPIVQRLLWLWRPIREWQSLSHLEHVKAVVGLLATPTVFLRSLFSSAFTCCVSSNCYNPTFTVSLQASLSVAVTSQNSVFMPSAWRSYVLEA